MRGITPYGSGAASASPSFSPRTARPPSAFRSMLLCWCFIAAIAIALSALLLDPPRGDLEGVAKLERLIPKIERAPALSPEARQAVDRLIARQSSFGGSNDHEMRRQLAVDRLTSAIKAKKENTVGSSIPRRHDDQADGF